MNYLHWGYEMLCQDGVEPEAYSGGCRLQRRGHGLKQAAHCSETGLPQPDGPSRDNVLQDKHVCDDTPIASECEAADRGKHGAVQCTGVGAEARKSRETVCVRIV
jgi:hypothetical protein